MSTDPFDPDNVAATLDAAGFPLAVRTGQRRSTCDRYDQLQPWQRAIADALSVPVAGPDSTSGVTVASDRLGSCGHELDRWETHLEHHPECPADGSPCTCPEVCAACCGECE